MAAAGLGIWVAPRPENVDAGAWHLLAIFVATIVGIVARPLPMGAVALFGVAASVLVGPLDIQQALTGFANHVVWLIVVAFFIARSFTKTGLGRRLAYLFMAALGTRTLGLGYSLVATDLVLAPAIPSSTARAGGVLLPILLSLSKAYGSEPNGGTQRKIGAYLTLTVYQGTLITSSMFLTAMVANPLAAELAGDLGVEISWGMWALAALVPGVLSLIAIPAMLYRVYPPEIRQTPGAVRLARLELEKMGPVNRAERILICVFVALLGLWIFGRAVGVHSTTASLAGLGVLIVSGVLTWDDVCREEKAWNSLIWVGALVMMASYLSELGMISWFSGRVAAFAGGTHWMAALLIVSLVYYYSHYFFASATAHVSSMYPPLLALALSAGAPPLMTALLLGFFGNLNSATTHYGTGPSPVFFGAGFVEIGDWWRLGALVSLVHIVIWLGVGGLWWKALGLW